MQRQQEIVVFVYYALFDVVPEIGLQGKQKSSQTTENLIGKCTSAIDLSHFTYPVSKQYSDVGCN